MLGSKGIQKEFDKGNIVIDPFTASQLNPNSYDIRLGDWFILTKEIHHPIDLEVSDNDIWQDPIHLKYNTQFILEPGQCILAHTHECIGSYKHATLLKARSTFGRLFIDVCPSAGFGDIGYINRWTLEIKNNSTNYYILKPGMRIGQIAFNEIKGQGKSYIGSYLQHLDRSWKPEDMLPKLGNKRVF